MAGARPLARRLVTVAASLAVTAICAGAVGTSWPVDAGGVAASEDASARPGRLAILPDGRRLNLRCMGAGAPTVILEGGFAATSLAWPRVQPALAKRRRVCAYDRAGYGFSDAGPMPRDGAAVAKDLDDALKSARIAGPYILVGHSAGGLYIRLFADRRPRDIAALVFVDPSIEYQDRRFAEVFGPGAASLAGPRARALGCLESAEAGESPSRFPVACLPSAATAEPPAARAARIAEATRPATWRTQISELDTLWGRTSDEVRAGRQAFGPTPVIVLTAADTWAAAGPSAGPLAQALWVRLHDALAARSCRGRRLTVEGSSHMMMKDRPDAIVAAVDAVAETAKSPAGTCAPIGREASANR